MSSSSVTGLLLRASLTLVFAIMVDAQFSVPAVQIMANTPKGLKASILASTSMKAFEFHATVKVVGQETEVIVNGVATTIIDGRLTVVDDTVQLGEGDAVNYWVFVVHENLGYRKDDQQYIINRLLPPDAPFSDVINTVEGPPKPLRCDISRTTHNGRKACRGQLLFNENFSDRIVNEQVWKVEQRLPSDAMENEFVSYQRSPMSIKGNTLHIEPLLQHKQKGFDEDSIETGELDLTVGCSAVEKKLCMISSKQHKTIPPVVSSRMSTRNFFRFKYGKVEIRAKVPIGDWIYPIMYLEPLDHYYGQNYDSGIIRVAMVRGNANLRYNNQDLGGHTLSGSVLLSQFDPCRSEHTVVKHRSEPWANEYHVYGLVWEEEGIRFTVDDSDYGYVKAPPGGFKKYDQQCKELPWDGWKGDKSFAPFDKEFYVTIGVGVGGVSDFPDVPGKPWKNLEPKSMLNFWHNWTTWSTTWGGESRMIIDSVKVWAI